MAIEWCAAAGVLLVTILLLPHALAAAKRSARRGGGAGMVMAIGLAFSFLTDPRPPEVVERAAKKDDAANREHGGD